MKIFYVQSTKVENNIWLTIHDLSKRINSRIALAFFAALLPLGLLAQVPVISYQGPQSYNTGTAILPLTPTNTGGAVPTGLGLYYYTIAGGAAGFKNGTGTAASFNQPNGIAKDAAGNLYVADGTNNVIRKITPAGAVTTFAGSGTAGALDGTGTAASFSYLTGLAIDASGNLYVADDGNAKIRKVTAAGVVSTLATGNATNGIKYPQQVALDKAGNIYETDEGSGSVIKITTAGVVSKIAGGFTNPTGLAIDASGNFYVSDQTQVISKITPAGVVTTFAGTAYSSIFGNPYYLAVDASSNVYVMDGGFDEIEKVTPAGVITIIGGTRNTASTVTGFGTSATFNSPNGVTIDALGNLYITSTGDNTVRASVIPGYTITPALPAGLAINTSTGVIAGGATVASAAANYTVTATNKSGSGKAVVNIAVTSVAPVISYSGPKVYAAGSPIAPLVPTNTGGPVIASGLYGQTSTIINGFNPISTTSYSSFSLNGIVTDKAGNIYVADAFNYVVWKITPTGVVSALAGTPGVYGTSNGTGAAASFNGANGLTIDASGNLYLTEFDTQYASIRKITAAGVVTTLAQGTAYGTTGISEPEQITIDKSGNLYEADAGSNAIIKITSAGVVSTVVGGFAYPSGIALDAAGNFYVSDSSNHIFKVNPSAAVSVLAGSGTAADVNGTGAAAGFKVSGSLAIDLAGNIYLVEPGSNLIRKITPAGVVTTFAGSGTAGSNDGIGTAAGLNIPSTIALDGSGNIIFPSLGDNSIRKISTSGYSISPALPAGLSIDATGTITGTPTVVKAATIYTITLVSSGVAATTKVNISVTATAPTLSYSGPQSYTTGIAITPLAPASTGIVPITYSNTAINVGYNGNAMTADAIGNLYVSVDSSVYKIPAGGGARVQVAKHTAPINNFTVDSLGDVYIIYNATSLKKFPAAGGAASYVSTGAGLTPSSVFNDPYGHVFVNVARDIYGDYKGIEQVSASGVITPVAQGMLSVNASGADHHGNFFSSLTSPTINSQTELAVLPRGATKWIIRDSSFFDITGIAVDAADNYYVSDYNYQSVQYTLYKVPAGGGPKVAVAGPFNVGVPGAITVDARDNVFVVSTYQEEIKEVKATGGYFISPALPAGLSFDNNTGIISGTPTAAAPATIYTITAFNNLETSVVAKLNIKVAAPAAPTISYAGPQTYTVGSAITPLSPLSKNGTPVNFSATSSVLSFAIIGQNGMAVDASGNIYLSNPAGSTVLKQPASGGAKVTVGSGFNSPEGLAVDASGNVYIADANNNALKKVAAAGGTPVTISTAFTTPNSVTVDAAGNIYIADATSAYKITAGTTTPVVIASGFIAPNGIAVDAAGTVYVSDGASINNDYVVNQLIYKIPPGGSKTALPLNLSEPFGVSADKMGNLYTVDKGVVKMIPASNANPITLAPEIAYYPAASSITLDAAGNFYIAYNQTVDDNANSLAHPNSSIVKIALTGGFYLSKPLPAGLNFDNNTGIISGTPSALSSAATYGITSVGISGKGTATVSIAVSASTVAAPTLSYTGPQSYIAGTTIQPLSPASAGVAAPAFNKTPTVLASGFSNPQGVAVDKAGNIYVTDYTNNLVKKIPVAGGGPVTIGKGFSQPTGITVDAAGNVFVVDYGNNAIKKIPAGAVNAVTFASGVYPQAITTDAGGNVYYLINGYEIDRIPAAGGTPTVYLTGNTNGGAGTFTMDSAGNVYLSGFGGGGDGQVQFLPAGGGAAVILAWGLLNPTGVTIDGAGNIYVADYTKGAIYQIPGGKVTPGTLTSSFNESYYEISPGPDVNLVPVATGFTNLTALAIDATGKLYATDAGTGQVKQIKPLGGYFINPALPAGLTFNSSTGVISGTPTAASAATVYTATAYNAGGSASATVSIQTTLPAAPTLSYSATQTYTAGAAITPLAPVSKNVGVPGYNGKPTTLGTSANYILALAADHTGNVYLAENGVTGITEIPASGGAQLTLATPYAPTGVASDQAGNLYYSDSYDGTIYKMPAGTGSSVPLVPNALPGGIAIDAANNIFFLGNDGGSSSYLDEAPAGSGYFSTLLVNPNFYAGLAVDAADNVYTIDYTSKQLTKRPGNGGQPVTYGPTFVRPVGIAVDGAGNVFVSDEDNNTLTELPVSGGAPVNISPGSFNQPEYITSGPYGRLYIANVADNTIKMLKPTGGYYLSGTLPPGLTFDGNTGIISGTPTTASPTTTYTVAAYNATSAITATVKIQVVLPALPVVSYSMPKVYTLNTAIAPLAPSGSGVAPAAYAPGSTFASGFSGPDGVAVDASGNVYVTDSTLNVIKKIPVAGGTVVNIAMGTQYVMPASFLAVNAAGDIYVIAGDIYKVPHGGGATIVTNIANQLASTSLGIDSAGNAYLAGYDNSNGQSAVYIIKAGSNGPILLGTGFNEPVAATVDAAGNVYVCDNGDNVLKEIPANGGNPIILASGFMDISHVAVDASGNVYVTDSGGTETLVEKIPAGGGTPIVLTTSIPVPMGIAVDGAGNVFVTDIKNETVKKIKPTGGYYISTAPPPGLKFDGVTGIISGTPTVVSPAKNYTITGYNTGGGTASTTNIKVVSANNGLLNLALSTGKLSPVFKTDSLNYTTTVAATIASISLTPTLADLNSTVKVNGVVVASGAASAAIALSSGSNKITAVVTSQSGVAKIYTVTVTRQLSAVATLSALTLSQGTLAPVFAAGTTTYTASVTNATASITLTPTATTTVTSIKVNGAVVASGSASPAIALAVGSNKVTIIVTAQDGVTIDTYTLTVTRAAGGDNIPDATVSVDKPNGVGVQNFEPLIADDGVAVHQGLSPNGDGINDFLEIDNISQYPDNSLKIMNRNGQLVFEAKGYDNAAKVFDGHSNKNGQMQLPGTYFYSLDYVVKGVVKHKSGFLVLKY